MKTLDEVIKGIEHCHEDNCMDCPYQFEPKDFGCVDQANYTDALHYLKEFQGLSKMWNDKLDKEQDNPPLTWDELLQMEGKPVWIENFDAIIGSTRGWVSKKWMLVEFVNNFYFDARNSDGEQYNFDKDEQDKAWQAYRKERE